MAEPVGTTLGALGVVGLLSVCLDCFQFIEDGRSVGKGFTLLHGEFINQQFRFRVWTRVSGFFSEGGYDRRLDNPEVKAQVRSQLNSIALLFMDARKVVNKYQLVQVTNQVAAPGEHAGFIEEGLHGFLKRIKQTKRQAGVLGAFSWALKNKRGFETMLQSLEKCIDALYFATDNLDLFDQASLRNAIEIEIESIDEVEILSSIAASSKSFTSNNLISDAASQRITNSRGRDIDECNSSGPQTFVTAPEYQSIQERLATPQENSVDVAFERLDSYTDSNLMKVLEALVIEYRKYSDPWSSIQEPSFDRLAKSSRQQTDLDIIGSARGRYDEIIAETPSWVMDRLQQLTAIVKGAIASCAWSNPHVPEGIDRYEMMRFAHEHLFKIDPVLVDDSDAVENVNIFRTTLCKLTQSNQCSYDTSRSCITIATNVVSVTGEPDDLYKVAHFWSFIQCLQFSRVSSSAQIQGVSLSENGWGAQLKSIKQLDAEANSIWPPRTMIQDGHRCPRRVMNEISDMEYSFMSFRAIKVEGDNAEAIVTFEGLVSSSSTLYTLETIPWPHRRFAS
ncbi:hypothetical protein PG984_003314 [Apiospora sp. TS-2023a]